ncbi:TetR/AcrR family transcriptional regulator [Pseudonocardia parietis]|uniref:AcrR family transcriptional regulator n=1 Tax=Pseudonocardia parietis TaxID=570936 RepID=A0ABS4VKJ7_9PSEU|nr:TetR family transcriptional regulator [Pseudonocardia parietis]MBP2364446.1 AcrR family transcriptional regulator [Pseudonocardia parietis]
MPVDSEPGDPEMSPGASRMREPGSRGSVLGAGPGRPRRRRLSDAETERLMLETAAAAVAELGLTVSLDHLRLEDVIREAGVARSAVYRRWPSKGEFLGDLLLELARGQAPMAATGIEEASGTLRRILGERIDDLATADGRMRIAAEVLREAVDADFRRVLEAPGWRTYLALTATLAGMEESGLRDEVGTALAASESRLTDGIVRNQEAIARLLGLRLRPGPALEDLAHLGNALMRGLVIKVLVQPELAGRRVAASPGGEPEDWSLVTFGMARLLLAGLEPDPDRPWDAERTARLRSALDAGTDLPELADGF